MARNRRARVEAGWDGREKRRAGYSISFVAAREKRRARARKLAFRARGLPVDGTINGRDTRLFWIGNFRICWCLRASRGRRESPRAGRLWAPALKIDEISSLYFALAAYTCSSGLHRASVISAKKQTLRIRSLRKFCGRGVSRASTILQSDLRMNYVRAIYQLVLWICRMLERLCRTIQNTKRIQAERLWRCIMTNRSNRLLSVRSNE